MNRRTLFYGAIAAAIILLALSVYYLTPGVYHPLTFSGSPTDTHLKHAVAFGGLAVICVLVALVSRRRAAPTGPGWGQQLLQQPLPQQQGWGQPGSSIHQSPQQQGWGQPVPPPLPPHQGWDGQPLAPQPVPPQQGWGQQPQLFPQQQASRQPVPPQPPQQQGWSQARPSQSFPQQQSWGRIPAPLEEQWHSSS